VITLVILFETHDKSPHLEVPASLQRVWQLDLVRDGGTVVHHEDSVGLRIVRDAKE